MKAVLSVNTLNSIVDFIDYTALWKRYGCRKRIYLFKIRQPKVCLRQPDFFWVYILDYNYDYVSTIIEVVKTWLTRFEINKINVYTNLSI